jgi:hypothetical protein
MSDSYIVLVGIGQPQRGNYQFSLDVSFDFLGSCLEKTDYVFFSRFDDPLLTGRQALLCFLLKHYN